MAQQPVSDGSLGWCTPSTIGPQNWITGFSDNSDTFLCALSGSRTDLTDKMAQHCCKGAVQKSDDGCYQWCRPIAKDKDNWATCISDHIYTDTLQFGQACNDIGTIERKNAHNLYLVLRPGPDPNAGISLSSSRKLSLVLGIVLLIQMI